MNCLGYYRGTPDDGQQALLYEFAKNRGFELDDVLFDLPGEFGSFRKLQNAVKLGLCDIVLLPSCNSLADDRYLSIENRLFLLRNGVKPVFISKGNLDNRHEIALNISRYFSCITDWDSAYGTALPLKNTFRDFKRTPPIGYKIVNGEAAVDKNEAAAVKEIFIRYARGEQLKDIYHAVRDKYGFGGSFGNMTVKTILKNERYLGRMSKKGYHLPPIIRYDEWLAVKERLEAEYVTVSGNDPFIGVSYSSVPVVCFRGEKQAKALRNINRASGGLFLDTVSFEKAVEAIIAELASETNAQAFYLNHVLTERSRASASLPKAEEVLGKYNEEVFRDISLIKNGERSENVQNRLEKNNDIRVFCAMRLRRIRSEVELYSITKDQVLAFFKRAREMSRLSFEEKGFIAHAFISSVSVVNGRIWIVLRDPTDRKRKTVFVDNYLSE